VPDISVVITVYNKAKFIKNTLQSVFNQTFHDFEIIVVNDGSTDNSLDIIKSFNEDRIKLITIENQGASAARNTGINSASADYIALLDGDDLWDKDFLKYIKQAISKFPEEHIFATGLSQKYDKKTVPVAYSFKQNKLFGIHNYFEASKKYAILSSSSVVFHRSVLEKTGQFDPDITSGQDIDLWIRFGMHFNIVFINKPLAIYNHVITSLSKIGLQLRPTIFKI
jgi:glycosyltransferase involved in cell wall biosynthesis